MFQKQMTSTPLVNGMDRRLWLLALAGAVIFGLVLFRERQQDYLRSLPPSERPLPRRGAPAFQLYDHHKPSQFVKFERYLGRTKILLVFFDGKIGLDADSETRVLLEHAEDLTRHGVQVVAVSLATPQANRLALDRSGITKAPFPILTDVDLQGPIDAPAHRLYGLFDEQTGQTRTGLFLIDRKQSIAMNLRTGAPYPVDDPQYVIQQLIIGNWPAEQATSIAER